MAKRGHGEGTVEWDKKRQCYFAKVTYTDPKSGEKRRKKIKGTQKINETLKKGREWQEAVESGRLIPDAHAITLGEWIDIWIAEYVKPNVRVKSYDKYEGCLRCYVKPVLGNVPLSKLRSPDVQRLFNRLLTEGGASSQGISTSTVKATRRYLSMALQQAVKAGLILRNIVADTKPPKLIKAEIRPLTKEQAEALLVAAKKSGKVPYIVILLALTTGMRLGEIFGIKWDCVDLGRKVINVRRSIITGVSRRKTFEENFQEPKTQKSRRQIAISSGVARALRRHKAWQKWKKRILGDKFHDHNLVVTNILGGILNTSNFTSRSFKEMLESAGIETSFKFHDLRHTHASLLLRAGVHPKVVQERLGHSTVTMTLDTYSHLLPDMQDKAVDALEFLDT